MISVDEALERILAAMDERGVLGTEIVALADAAGRILREVVTADRDMPPFTRSAMDGYALRADDTRSAPVTLEVIEQIPAGYDPARTVGPGQASKIMTGAQLPAGADAVQMVEKTTAADADRVVVLATVAPGEHVRSKGEEIVRGSVLVEQGRRLGAIDIGLLATVGRPFVKVSLRPRVSILPTGDELVPVDVEPSGSRIRESNGHTLAPLVKRAGGIPDLYDIARDTLADLESKISRALTASDIVLLSGGVSMGDYDLVGKALAASGCRPIFDRVAIQPGKPLFFGRAGSDGEVPVFGLPGNPVSTVVDFLIFVRPAIRRMMGETTWLDPVVEGRLAGPIKRRAGRQAYLPAVIGFAHGEMTLTPIHSTGSADMVAIYRADALAIIPAQAEDLEAGVRVRALPLPGLTEP